MKIEVVKAVSGGLFGGKWVGDKQAVWMSHGDVVVRFLEGFEVVARSQQGAIAAVENRKRRSFGLHYHPEDVTEDSFASDQGILKCSFMRNTDQPTDFSFASSTSFPLRVCGNKGPLFEDGPNFDTTIRLFHGRDGVVPLSGNSFVRSKNLEHE